MCMSQDNNKLLEYLNMDAPPESQEILDRLTAHLQQDTTPAHLNALFDRPMDLNPFADH